MGLNIAIIQKSPIPFNLQASVELAEQLIKENQDCDLVVFGETWLTGYPAWIDHVPNLNLWGDDRLKSWYALLLQESPNLHDPGIRRISNVARETRTSIIMGLHEKSKQGRSLYNSVIGISEHGDLVLHHRKMNPTFTEKLIHQRSEQFDLDILEVNNFRIGALICWEHWMPLARQYYHDQNEEIHIALWPSVHEMHQIASRHYAFEGRCYVIAVGQFLTKELLPSEIQEELVSKPKDLLHGGSCMISPNGTYLVTPQSDPTQEIIRIEIKDKACMLQENLTMDVSGHYFRSDLFDFKIKTS